MVTRHSLLLLCAVFVVNQSLNLTAQNSRPGVAAKVAAGSSASKDDAQVLKSKKTVTDSSKSPKSTQKPTVKSKTAAVDSSKSSQKQTTGSCGSDCSCWR